MRKMYTYTKMTSAQRIRVLTPPIFESILAMPEDVDRITLVVAFPIEPTTFLSRSPTPSRVSCIPWPRDRIIRLPPLASDDMVEPKILPMPEIMFPFPSAR